MRTLEERLERLERANRRWRYAAGLFAIVVLVGLTGAANKSNDIAEVLRARRIEVVAPDGEASIELRADARQATLSLLGPNGERGIGLMVEDKQAALMLMKHKEAPLLSARVDDDGAMLFMQDGREPTQKPNMILVSSTYSDKSKRGQAGVNLHRGSLRKDSVELGFFMKDEGEGSGVFLGGPRGKHAWMRVDQASGKVQLLGENRNTIWSSP